MISPDARPLQTAAQAALTLANARQRTMLCVASWTCAWGVDRAGAPDADAAFRALRGVAAFQDEPRMVWARGETWGLAIGAHETHTARGPERIDSARLAAARWRDRSLDTTLPVWSGFSFSDDITPASSASTRWDDWPAAAVVLPRVVIEGTAGSADHTVRVWAVTHAAPGDAEADVIARLERLLAPIDAHLSTRRDAHPGDDAVSRETAEVRDTPVRHTQPAALDARCDEPHVEAWSDAVDALNAVFSDTPLRKVVLARAVDLELERAPDPGEVLARLHARYPTCCTFGVQQRADGAVFLGATPETLVRKRGDRIEVDALAGSASPDVHPDTLLHSAKDRLEHALVVEAIHDALHDLARLEIPDAPVVDVLPNILHLRTQITGTLDTSRDVLELAARLHPTPAVCGLPRALARARLLDTERALAFERGWYTGALGWSTLAGDGALRVALRCALLHDTHARLFVGAGMVPGSVGALEVRETRHKARPVHDALTLNAPGDLS